MIDDPRPLLHAALTAFGARLAHVPDQAWAHPTPCDGWTVRDLVGHVVEEERFGPPLLAGTSVAEIDDGAGDVLGSDPRASWREAAAGLRAAIDHAGALDARVALPGAAGTGRGFLLELFADHLVHAWDLARATGAGEQLPRRLVAACAAWFDDHEDTWRAAGEIGEAAPVAADADAQTRLLARFGRSTAGRARS